MKYLTQQINNVMLSKDEVSEGMKVCYAPPFGKKENGIVKTIHPSLEAAWVVYHCNNEWDNYRNYTGALTELDDLMGGWDKNIISNQQIP